MDFFGKKSHSHSETGCWVGIPPNTGIRSDLLLKGSKDHFGWEFLIQMGDHTPQPGEGPIIKIVLLCIRVYDQGK